MQVSSALNLAVNNRALARQVIDAALSAPDVAKFIKICTMFGRFTGEMLEPMYTKVRFCSATSVALRKLTVHVVLDSIHSQAQGYCIGP